MKKISDCKRNFQTIPINKQIPKQSFFAKTKLLLEMKAQIYKKKKRQNIHHISHLVATPKKKKKIWNTVKNKCKNILRKNDLCYIVRRNDHNKINNLSRRHRMSIKQNISKHRKITHALLHCKSTKTRINSFGISN